MTNYRIGTKTLLVKIVHEAEREALHCGDCRWRGNVAKAKACGSWEEREVLCPRCGTLLGMISRSLTGTLEEAEAYTSSVASEEGSTVFDVGELNG